MVLALAAAACGDRTHGAAYAVPGERGDPIRVEILNGTSRAGLARIGTRMLRRAGIDVVYFGNAPTAQADPDSTRIVVRRGTRAAGERVRRALGVGTIAVETDTARLLEVTVLLGMDFAPRLEFHP